MGIDPAALGELAEQCAIEAARGAVIDILDGGLMAQPGVTQAREKPCRGDELTSQSSSRPSHSGCVKSGRPSPDASISPNALAMPLRPS